MAVKFCFAYMSPLPLLEVDIVHHGCCLAPQSVLPFFLASVASNSNFLVGTCLWLSPDYGYQWEGVEYPLFTIKKIGNFLFLHPHKES
jgi:hypothetical protein